MSEQRFKLSSETVLQYQIMDNDTDLNENEVVDLLNEQQSTIEQQERKIRKCEAEVGRQLKQIIDLQDELNECRARPTLATDERGVVKVEYKCR